jgi:hypothetical protein
MWLSLLHIWFEACYAWKICFYVKKPIYAKIYSCSMILMVSSHIYVLIFITYPSTTHTHTHTYIYIYKYIYIYIYCWSYTKIRWISSFRVVSGTTKAVFTGLWPRHIRLARHVRVSGFSLYKGDRVPLGTVSSFFHPNPSVCDGWALPRWFGAASTKTIQFLGDLTPPSPLVPQTLSRFSLLWYSSRFPFDFFNLLLISINVRSLCLEAPLGCRNHAMNLA